MKTDQIKKTEVASTERRLPTVERQTAQLQMESSVAPAWKLPGGIGLAEYALRGGFVASSLLTRGDRRR
jgi:hypothetical protein